MQHDRKNPDDQTEVDAGKLQDLQNSGKTVDDILDKIDEANASRIQDLRNSGKTVDDILDEIDEVYEENSDEFVRSYVQKGGQGESFDLTIQFLASTAALAIWQGMNYDLFKQLATQFFRRLHPPDEPVSQPTEAELRAGFAAAERVIDREKELNHSEEEAAAFKAIIFANEMHHRLGIVHLGFERYARLYLAAESQGLGPSRLAGQIIDEWLEGLADELQGRCCHATEGLRF